MSAHTFTTSDTFETGDLVCVDASTGEAVAYDAMLPVVGPALKPAEGFNTNGRQWYNVNGSPYYLNDFYTWEENLTSDFSTENVSYTPFNPLTDAGYIVAITSGIAAVKTSIVSGIPASWIKVKSNTTYDWYLIR